MVSSKSDVTSSVKQQASSSATQHSIYKLLEVNGGGKLIDMMKDASVTKDFRLIDQTIKSEVGPFLYNDGAGKMIPVEELIRVRNCIQTGNYPQKSKNHSNGMSQSNGDQSVENGHIGGE